MSFLEDFVPYSVVAPTPHAMIVSTVHSMVAKLVLSAIAMVGAAIRRRHQRKTEAVSHRRRKRPRVEVEVERRRWNCVDPISCVGEREREMAGLIAYVGVGDEIEARKGVDFG